MIAKLIQVIWNGPKNTLHRVFEPPCKKEEPPKKEKKGQGEINLKSKF